MSEDNDEINNHQENINIPEELATVIDHQVCDQDELDKAIRIQKIVLYKRKYIGLLRSRRERNSFVRQQQIENYKAMITREDRRKRYKLRQSREMNSSDNSKDSDGYQSSSPEPRSISDKTMDKTCKRVKFNI